MKHGPINSGESFARLVVAFLGCGLLSYLLFSRFGGGHSRPTDTARPVLSQKNGRSAALARQSARPHPVPPPRWEGTNTVPDISLPELSQFDLATLESHDDLPRAQMFTQLRSAIIRTMSPLISAARSKCPGEILRSTVRLKLTIESKTNEGSEITRVDEIINFAGAPVPDGTLTCIFTDLKNHSFPVPVTSVPRSDLVTFKGEMFVNARL
jgi:hypothetical protein